MLELCTFLIIYKYFDPYNQKIFANNNKITITTNKKGIELMSKERLQSMIRMHPI